MGKIGRVRSELFERDVYSCQGEAERRSTQQTLQAACWRGKRRRYERERERERDGSKGGKEERRGRKRERKRMIEKLRRKRGSPRYYVLLNGMGVSARMEE